MAGGEVTGARREDFPMNPETVDAGRDTSGGYKVDVVRPRTFYCPWQEFSGFDQDYRLVMPPDFVSPIGAAGLRSQKVCNRQFGDFRGTENAARERRRAVRRIGICCATVLSVSLRTGQLNVQPWIENVDDRA